MENIKKYDIWLIKLDPIMWSEQSWIRPCLVIQNDDFFRYQNTTLVLPISSKLDKKWMFSVIINDYKNCWLDRKSRILVFQLRTADKSRFIKKLWKINDKKLRLEIKKALDITIDMEDEFLEK